MKRLILVAMFMLSAVLGAYSQNKVKSPLVWDIEKVDAVIVDDFVEIAMKFVFIDDRVEKGAFVTLAPELKWIDKVYPLTPLSVCSQEVKNAPKSGMVIFSGKPGRKMEVRAKVPYDVGMNNFSISVRLSEFKSGKESKGEVRQVAIFSRKAKPQFL